jgi:hypothetical protein
MAGWTRSPRTPAFTDWQLEAGPSWRLTQTIQVTIPYGSSS